MLAFHCNLYHNMSIKFIFRIQLLYIIYLIENNFTNQFLNNEYLNMWRLYFTGDN